MHDKGAVHGRGPWQGAASPKLEKATAQPGRWAGAATARSEPHGDVALVSSVRWSPYHESGNPCSSFAWCCFVDCFIHENGNDNAVIIALWRVCDPAEDAEPMCTLSRRQSWPGEEKPPRGWRPRRAFGLVPSRGEVPRRGFSLGEARQAWRASPGLESLVLSEIF